MDFHNVVFWHNIVKVVNLLREGDKEWNVLAEDDDCCRTTLARCISKLKKDGFVVKKVSSKDKRKFVYSLNDTAFRAFCVERDFYSFVSETVDELGNMQADFADILKQKGKPVD